jgi:hypothetical protein
MSTYVAVPANLECLSKPALVKLVQNLVEERGMINTQSAAKSEETPKKRAATKPAMGESELKKVKMESATPLLSEKDKAKVIASLKKKSLAAIKKTAHNDKKKPYTEVCEGISRSDALALLGNVGSITANSARAQKRMLGPQDVAQLLGIDEVHPVKFDGKVWCLAGQRPSVYAWARVESLEIKVQDALMSLKFRTYMSGSGLPNAEGKCTSMEEHMAATLFR